MKIEKKTIYNKKLHNSNYYIIQIRICNKTGSYCCHYERLRSSLNYRRTRSSPNNRMPSR